MANITINEVSKSYVYDIANSNYATVAMPITSMWGPGIDYDTVKNNVGKLDQYSDVWQNFNATQEGIEAFARAYRGASSLYRIEKDYSYQMALTLLASGYNVSTVRITQGGTANLYGNINQFTYFDGMLARKGNSFVRDIKVAPDDDILKLFNNNGKTFEIGGIFGDYINQSDAEVSDNTVTFTIAQDSSITITIVKSKLVDGLVPVKITLTVPDGDATWNSISKYLWNGISNKTWNGLDGDSTPTAIAYSEVLSGNGTANSLLVTNNTIHLVLTNPREGVVSDKAPAEGVYYITSVIAKYPGTFGNRLVVDIRNNVYGGNTTVWNATTYIIQDNGGITPAESLNFVLDYEQSTDSLYYVDEISEYSDYIGSISLGNLTSFAGYKGGTYSSRLSVKDVGKGTDYNDAVGSEDISTKVTNAMAERGYDTYDAYYIKISDIVSDMVASEDFSDALYLLDAQQKFTAYYFLLDMLKDKLSFSPQFIIAGGWDDMCVSIFDSGADKFEVTPRVAPLHEKLMEVAYHSRCSCSLIDIPRDLPIDLVKTENTQLPGYVEKLSQQGDAIDNLYATHSALFTPWGHYTYVSMSRPVECAPSIEYLLIERAMIKNQATQYYWCLPTTRSHRLSFGKLDYKVSKSYLDSWQKEYGPDLNVITNVPSLGLSLWGNSTLYNTPVATYQALANLSTRLLVNAVEDLVYRCGIAITYQYNNNDAYSSFVAGVTPLLDTMVNVGAIDDFAIRMASGVNGLDSVKANEVVGLIYLVINGVINDITVDLVCLPAGTDLSQYRV